MILRIFGKSLLKSPIDRASCLCYTPFLMGVFFLAIVVGFAMAMAIGANDVANSMATAVGAKAITLKQAVIIAAVLEFTGAFCFGKMVTETIRKGILHPEIFTNPSVALQGGFAALLAATLWIYIATKWHFPVSTTHAIVGGMTGVGLAVGGVHAIQWATLGKIGLSWIE